MKQLSKINNNQNDNFINCANAITLIRLILVAVIIILLYPNLGQTMFLTAHNYHLNLRYMIAGIIFVIASLSDALDGYVARHYNQETIFGKFFDAIADKILTNAVIIMFMAIKIVPIWIGLILILRDFYVDVIRQVLASYQIVLSAKIIGKITTVLKMIALTFLFFISAVTLTFTDKILTQQLTLVPIYITTLLSVISASYYTVFFIQSFSKEIKKQI